MEFSDFIKDTRQAATEMVDNPGDSWRRGFGAAGEEQDLAAALHFAKKGFPKGGKSVSVFPPKRTALLGELLEIAREMERAGQVTIDRDGFGLFYVGEPNAVRELMRLTIRRKPGMLPDEEQHRRVGEILGYDPQAIDEFIKRMSQKNLLHPDLR